MAGFCLTVYRACGNLICFPCGKGIVRELKQEMHFGPSPAGMQVSGICVVSAPVRFSRIGLLRNLGRRVYVRNCRRLRAR